MRTRPVYGTENVRSCIGCGWFRDVTKDPDAVRTYVYHPVWGRVTVREAAELDARHHDCDAHRTALVKLRTVLREVQKALQVRMREDAAA